MLTSSSLFVDCVQKALASMAYYSKKKISNKEQLQDCLHTGQKVKIKSKSRKSENKDYHSWTGYAKTTPVKWMSAKSFFDYFTSS